MLSACYTNVTKSGRLIVNIVENDNQVKTRFATFYDMKDIETVRDFEIPIEHERSFVEALYSDKGRQVLNRLKNSRVDRIINSFLSYYKKNVNCYKIESTQPLTRKPILGDFVEEILKTPLAGRNRIPPVTVGITKRQIFEALYNEGLIK